MTVLMLVVPIAKVVKWKLKELAHLKPFNYKLLSQLSPQQVELIIEIVKADKESGIVWV